MGHKSRKMAKRRAASHGDWDAASRSVAAARAAFPMTNNPGVDQAVYMMLVKIGRITHGDATLADHWRDIAGYAQLGQYSARGT